MAGKRPRQRSKISQARQAVQNTRRLPNTTAVSAFKAGLRKLKG